MNIKDFKTHAETLLIPFEDFINEMPGKGLKCCDSQKICFLQRINKMYALINGTKQNDLEDE